MSFQIRIRLQELKPVFRFFRKHSLSIFLLISTLLVLFTQRMSSAAITVSTVSVSEATAINTQQKIFYDGTNWWTFYVKNDGNVYYKYSSDLSSWSNEYSTAVGGTMNTARRLTVGFKNINNNLVVILGVDDSNDPKLYYKRGTISGTTITWGNYNSIAQDGNAGYDRGQTWALDSSNYYWTIGIRINATPYTVNTKRSTNADLGNSFDDTWNSSNGLDSGIDGTYGIPHKIIALSGQDMLAVWNRGNVGSPAYALVSKKYDNVDGWDTSYLTLETIDNAYDWDAVRLDNGATVTAHTVYLEGNQLTHKKWTDNAWVAGASFGSHTAVKTTNGVSLCPDPDNNKLYSFYIGSDNGVYYKLYSQTADSWGDEQTLASAAGTRTFISCSYQPGNNKIAVLWTEVNGANYDIVVDSVTTNSVPSAPTSLSQYKSDCSTSIATGGWTNETSVCLQGYLDDPDASDQVKLQAEVTTGTFSNSPTDTAASYCADPCTSSVTVTGLSDGSQYKWQARSIDDDSTTSSFTQFNSGNIAFSIDATNPSCSISSITETSSYAYVTGSVIYYNTASTGSFTVNTSASDSQSGIEKVNFPDTVSTGGDDNSFPYSYDYSWDSLDTFSQSTNITCFNNASGTATASFTVTKDITSPSGGSISYTDGYYTSTSVSLTVDDGTDSQSGIDTSTRTLQRREATLSNGSCGSYGSWSNITPAGSYPNFTDSTVLDGNCYQYQYLVSDNVSNQATYTSANTAQIDTSTPDIVAVDAGPSAADRTSLTANTWFKHSNTGSDDIISFSWTNPNSPSADTFYYELNTEPGGTISGNESNTTNPYQDDVLITEGTSYFHLKPKNGAGTWGTERIFTIKYDKTPPTNVGISLVLADSSSQLTITAQTVQDSASGLHSTPYWFQETSGNPGASSSTEWQTSATFVDDGLLANTQYIYQVKTRDVLDNRSSYSTTSSKYTLANTPGVPTITNASISTLDVIITQNSNPSNTFYAIYETNTSKYLDSTDGSLDLPTEDWQTYATFGGASGITVMGLAENTTYTFKVKAKNGENVETNFGPTASGTTPPSIPTAPSNFLGTVDSSSAVTWSWQDNSNNETGFRVHDSSHHIITTTSTNTTSAQETSLSPNAQYQRHVHAYNASGESNPSNSVSKYTLANVPSNLTLTADSQTQITANWSANSNPVGSEYFSENTTAGTNSGWLTSLSWTSSGLTCGTNYSFRVKARNGDDVETDFGEIVSLFTPDCSPPTGGGMPAEWHNPPIPPTEGFGILINNDAPKTNSRFATLILRGGPNTERMAISNFSDFRDAGQETYKTNKEWDLCKGLSSCVEGMYTVYTKFYASWGTSSEVVSDSILYKIKIEESKEEVEKPIAELPPPIVTPPIEKPPKPPLIERVPEILKPLVPEFLKPKPSEIKPPEIPLEELTPKEAPLVFQGKWQLLPSKPIREFVLAPLPKEIGKLVQKFPELERTFEEVGITKITDIEKLKTVKLTLPGLTERVGLPTIKVEPGKFALPQAVPVAKLSSEIKQKLPTEIVFAKTGGELIDFNTALTVGKKGEPQQKITTISGKPLQLVVKPDKPVRSIKGYVVFKSKLKTQAIKTIATLSNDKFLIPNAKQNDKFLMSNIKNILGIGSLDTANSLEIRNWELEIPLRSLLGSVFFAVPSFAKEHNPVEIKTRLVLLEFEYTDSDGDGIYTAEIQAPLTEGEYEIITVMDFEDEELGTKEIRLITVVDPEGYIYEKDDDKETRIPGAIVSLFWLNSETKQYEIWPAKEYQQENPQTTDVRGSYSFLVPGGYYYLKVEAPGYPVYDGKPFQAKEGSGIHINIELRTKYWWLKIVDWKTILLIAVIILLLYNFYRDKIREKLIESKNKGNA